jgi:hypothetical protein
MVGFLISGFFFSGAGLGLVLMGKDVKVIFKTRDFGPSSDRLSRHLKFRHNRRP